MSIFTVIFVACISTLTDTGQSSCSRNAYLINSIQHQLKLVDDNDRKCAQDCTGNCSETDKVAFMAKNSVALQNLPSKSVVVFNSAITNLGNGYNSYTGIFTAPSNGVYVFSWTILGQQWKKFYTDLTLNGNVVARNYVSAVNVQDHPSGSQNVVLEIKKDDKVLVRVQAGHKGQYMYADGWSSFSGYKL
ncbi:complement C1q-like protein 4 [Mytilus galloprovincialis]|uniref:complement C1q-like protein 4 n=1 Tax=Mytilus galloprovincialis TaxID=29158 RepID=UPI003F7BEE91